MDSSDLTNAMKQANERARKFRRANEEAIVLLKTDGKSCDIQGFINVMKRLAFFDISFVGQIVRGDILERKSDPGQLWRVRDCNRQTIRLAAELEKLAPNGDVIPMRGSEPVRTVQQNAGTMNINNMAGATIGNFANQMSGNAKQVNNSVPDKSLAEAAQEIQVLLDQLSQTYPSETRREKFNLAEAASDQARANLTLRQRLLSALDAGTIGAVGEMLSHPASTFFIDAVKDWEETNPVA